MGSNKDLLNKKLSYLFPFYNVNSNAYTYVLPPLTYNIPAQKMCFKARNVLVAGRWYINYEEVRLIRGLNEVGCVEEDNY